MKNLRLAVWTAGFMLCWTATAHAAFVTSALFGAAFAATIAGQIVTLLITTAVSFGISLLRAALSKKNQAKEAEQQPPGVKLDIEVGDNTPLAFVVGYSATAGTRKYIGTWGSSGKTPNAYLTDVIQIGDLSAPGQPGMFVNGERVTILWGASPTSQGYPVEEYRDSSGKDHLWVKYLDGTQTTADSFLLSRFASSTSRPWRTDMIGRGTPLMVVTALFNRELFPGQLRYLFEPPPVKFYDVRKDSTAGGSGSHRWSTPSTWEATTNPAVIIYNIIRGIYYGTPGVGEWLFGGQNLAAFRLPTASWMAAMNACDEAINLSGGGTEPRSRAGMEIRGDMEPMDVIEELLKTCSGRLAEVGGMFKLTIGTPSAAVYSFTDGDILVTEAQGFKPFPRLDDTFNGIEATYPSPGEAWATKDAPTRYSSALETADGGRRLVAGVSFPAAPYATQVQRLMKAMIEEERRFRVHQIVLPPDAWLLEPNDVVAWSSARNGYSAKKFLVSQMSGRRTRNQGIVLKEIDPTDYDWSSDEELPVTVGPLGPIRAPAQEIVDWFAEGETQIINGKQRAGCRLTWDGDQDDVARVVWEIRDADTLAIVHNGGTDSPELGSAFVSQGQFSGEQYQARGKYVPFTGRATIWSDWLLYTTPDSPQTDIAVLLRQFQEDARNILQKVADVRNEFRAVSERLAFDTVLGLGSNKKSLAATVRTSRALANSFIELEAEINDPETGLEATATLAAGVVAQVDNISADGLLRFAANASTIGGADSRLDMLVSAEVDGVYTQAGLSAQATVDGETVTSDLLLFADRIFMTDGAGTYAPFVITGGALYADQLNVNGANIVDATISNAKIQNAAITNAKIGSAAISNAKIGNLEVDTIKINYNSIADNGSASGSGVTAGADWVTVASVTISNPTSDKPTIYYTTAATFNAGGSSGSVSMRLINVTTGAVLSGSGGNASPGSGGIIDQGVPAGTVIDSSAGPSATYRLQAKRFGDIIGSSCGGTILVTWKKR